MRLNEKMVTVNSTHKQTQEKMKSGSTSRENQVEKRSKGEKMMSTEFHKVGHLTYLQVLSRGNALAEAFESVKDRQSTQNAHDDHDHMMCHEQQQFCSSLTKLPFI